MQVDGSLTFKGWLLNRSYNEIGCQASKTAFRSHCARPDGTLHTYCVSEASCPNFQPRAHAGLTGLTMK